MTDWQLTTLHALGLAAQGLADSAPPAPSAAPPAHQVQSGPSTLPAPPEPDAPLPLPTAPSAPGDTAAHDPLTAPPAPHEQPAPRTPNDQASGYAGQHTPAAPPGALAAHPQNVPFAAPTDAGVAAPGNMPGAGAPDVLPEPGGAAGAAYGEAFEARQAAPPSGEAVWAQTASPSIAPIVGELMRRTRHGDPLARRVGRGVRRAVGARAAQTVREQEAAAAILGQVVSSCRRIAVTSLRGGAGKTTVAALVARTIAAHRGDRTLVVDADPSLGSLPLRLGVNAERAYRGLTTLPNWEAAQSYLTQVGERLWAASASASFALSQELDVAELQTALGEFSRYFGITLVDCGPGLTSALHQGILASSHAQILIAPATVDGALSTRSALDWFLRGPHAHLLQRTVVVLVNHTPHVDGDLNRSRALLAAEGVPVIHLPYDRHLAAGTALDAELLAEASQATAVHLATAAFTRANT